MACSSIDTGVEKQQPICGRLRIVPCRRMTQGPHPHRQLDSHLGRTTGAVQYPGEGNPACRACARNPLGGELGNPPPVGEDEADVRRIEDASDSHPRELRPGSQVRDGELEPLGEQYPSNAPRDGVGEGRFAGRSTEQLKMGTDRNELGFARKLERSLGRPQAIALKAGKLSRGHTQLLREGGIGIAVHREGLRGSGGEIAGEKRRNRCLPDPTLAGDRDLQRTGVLLLPAVRSPEPPAGFNATNSW
jgi:hypothetical protein